MTSDTNSTTPTIAHAAAPDARARRSSFNWGEFQKMSPLATRMRSASISSISDDESPSPATPNPTMTAGFFARRASFAQQRFKRAPSVDEERILKGEYSF